MTLELKSEREIERKREKRGKGFRLGNVHFADWLFQGEER